jgi:hypothetical protein
VSVIVPDVDGEILEIETAKFAVHCVLMDADAYVEPDVA